MESFAENEWVAPRVSLETRELETKPEACAQLRREIASHFQLSPQARLRHTETDQAFADALMEHMIHRGEGGKPHLACVECWIFYQQQRMAAA